jgi:dephospho-CoA kinase
MARDALTEERARERIRAQKDETFFRARCDAVFENGYPTPEAAEDAALDLFKTLL